MNIDLITKKLPDWIEDGNPLRSLLFSKVKIVRNVIGFSFPGKSTDKSKLEIRDVVLNAMNNTLSSFNLHVFNIEEEDFLKYLNIKLAQSRFLLGVEKVKVKTII